MLCRVQQTRPRNTTTTTTKARRCHNYIRLQQKRNMCSPFRISTDNSTSPHLGKLIFSTCGELASKHCSLDPPIREDGNHRMPNHIQAQLFWPSSFATHLATVHNFHNVFSARRSRRGWLSSRPQSARSMARASPRSRQRSAQSPHLRASASDNHKAAINGCSKHFDCPAIM